LNGDHGRGMRELIINAAAWQTRADLYFSFFAVVGTPPWHGKNFNALRDSIGIGQINEIEVPYRLVLSNYNLVPPAMKKDAENFAST
jgi:hypothetical protein